MAGTQGSLTCRENLRHGRRLYFPPKEGMLWIFFARKIRRLWPGSNPRSWVPEASMLTTRPPKPLLSFNKTQFRIVVGLLTGHNTLRRHFYSIGLTNNPLCRRCGTEEETSFHILSKVWSLGFTHTCISGFRFLGHRGYWESVWGPSGTLVKEQGSLDLVSDFGHKGPIIRPGASGPQGLEPNYCSNLITNKISSVN